MEPNHPQWPGDWQIEYPPADHQGLTPSTTRNKTDNREIDSAHFSQEVPSDPGLPNAHNAENNPVTQHQEQLPPQQQYESTITAGRHDEAHSTGSEFSYPPQYHHHPSDNNDRPIIPYTQAREGHEEQDVPAHHTQDYYLSQPQVWSSNSTQYPGTWPHPQAPETLPEAASFAFDTAQSYAHNQQLPEIHDQASVLYAENYDFQQQHYHQAYYQGPSTYLDQYQMYNQDPFPGHTEPQAAIQTVLHQPQPSYTPDEIEDDLAALDYPDPIASYGTATSFPIQQRIQALPATMDQADLMDSQPGYIVSQYFWSLDEPASLQHISQGPEWYVVRDDPAFADIARDGVVVSFKDLDLRKQALEMSFGDDESLDTGGIDASGMQEYYAPSESDPRDWRQHLAPIEADPRDRWQHSVPSNSDPKDRRQYPARFQTDRRSYQPAPKRARHDTDSHLATEHAQRRFVTGRPELGPPYHQSSTSAMNQLNENPYGGGGGGSYYHSHHDQLHDSARPMHNNRAQYRNKKKHKSNNNNKNNINHWKPYDRPPPPLPPPPPGLTSCRKRAHSFY